MLIKVWRLLVRSSYSVSLSFIAIVCLLTVVVCGFMIGYELLPALTAVVAGIGLLAASLAVVAGSYGYMRRQFVVLRSRSDRTSAKSADAITRLRSEMSEQVAALQGVLVESIHELRQDSTELAAEAYLRERTLSKRVTGLVENVDDLSKRFHLYRQESVGKMIALAEVGGSCVGLFGDAELKVVADHYALTNPTASYWVLDSHDALGLAGLTSLRRMSSALRELGYWERSLGVLALVVAKTGAQKDLDSYRFRRGELSVFRGVYGTDITSEESKNYDGIDGHVLHIVGKSLPKTQSGYTLRTHYLALAQRDTGVYVSVASQMGEDDSTNQSGVQFVDSVPYYALEGATRTSLPLDEWLEQNIEALAGLVQRIRPSVLHAHSDFINGLAAEAVGRHFGIPVVYESRGFWEESWLSRTSQRFPDAPWSALFDRWGKPDAYVMRARMESYVRANATHIITLARVMKEHIVAQGLDASQISISPNAVNAEEFPVVSRSEGLSAEFQIEPEDLVVGYVSSIVEYEGIDVLLSAFDEVSRQVDIKIHLLIVGDGPVLGELKAQRDHLKTENVLFTGRIAHEHVLDYYSLIDIFVIPRKPAQVCQLVTPLKPFEAFSTGRAVVMSDVTALKEIAADSAAAEIFEAGNPAALAKVLLNLVSDPDRRKQLADRGAEWVRRERTWSRNAETNAEVYKKLGVELAVAAGDPSGPDLPFDYSAMVEWVAIQETEDFSRWFYSQTKFNSDDILITGWILKGFPPVKLNIPIAWDVVCRSERSWAFNLHTWEFMDPLIREYANDGDSEKLRWCVDIALDWIQKFVEENDAADGSMAWYDMALGLRSPRLMALIALSVKEGLPDSEVRRLIGGAMRHRYEHSLERSFNPRNNHGYYAAMGQTVLGNGLRPLPGMVLLEIQGQHRIKQMVADQFFDDGVHSEHSPDYHRMLLDSFELGIRQGFIEDDSVKSRISKAAHALGWMIKPDGQLVQFGDSPGRLMATGKPSHVGDPYTDFLVSKGNMGEHNPDSLRVFPTSGYAFVRSPQPRGRDDHESASYLAFAAAFHSRAHKHADDLNFVWSDRGQEVLVDGGRYGYGELLAADSPKRKEGYYYDSEQRQYVESTIAHNTVAADGENHDRRGRRPYGAGLAGCSEVEGIFELNGEVDHEYWIHRRRITFKPQEWLLVEDAVGSCDASLHDFRSWFNLSGALEVIQEENAFRVNHESWDEPLWITGWGEIGPILPVKGEENPLRGWRSVEDRTLQPTWSLGYALHQEESGLITTLFNFGDEPLTELPVDN